MLTHQYIVSKAAESSDGVRYFPSAVPTSHCNVDVAKAEARRLAEKHPGETFVVMRPVHEVCRPPKIAERAIGADDMSNFTPPH